MSDSDNDSSGTCSLCGGGRWKDWRRMKRRKDYVGANLVLAEIIGTYSRGPGDETWKSTEQLRLRSDGTPWPVADEPGWWKKFMEAGAIQREARDQMAFDEAKADADAKANANLDAVVHDFLTQFQFSAPPRSRRRRRSRRSRKPKGNVP